jgi:hypothetical protein
MAKPIQTDEMLYELLKELKADMNRQFGDMRKQLRDTKTDMKGELSDLSLRLSTLAAVMEQHSNSRLRWSSWLLAGVIAASSVVTVLLIRILSVIAWRVVDAGSYIV